MRRIHYITSTADLHYLFCINSFLQLTPSTLTQFRVNLSSLAFCKSFQNISNFHFYGIKHRIISKTTFYMLKVALDSNFVKKFKE